MQDNQQNGILLSNKRNEFLLYFSHRVNKNELSIHAVTWMNLELSEEASHKEPTYYMISFT